MTAKQTIWFNPKPRFQISRQRFSITAVFQNAKQPVPNPGLTRELHVVPH